MPRWAVVTGSGLKAAVAAGILFWWVNNAHQVNGIGLLRRQAWPVNSPWVWVAVGFAIGAVGELVHGARRVGHAHNIRASAEELGRKYAESYSLPPGASSMPVFAGWSSGRNAMTGREDELPVTVFDYTTVTRGSESDTVTERTVALLPVDGLPAFDLRPRTLGRRVLQWAGFEGLTFDPASTNPTDAETIRWFTQLFQLSAGDPVALLGDLLENSPPKLADQEEAIRRLFTPAVMASVSQYPAYAIQSRPGFLAVWRGSAVLPPRKRTELWDAAVDLRGFLTLPPEGEAGPVVPGRVGTDVSRQARRLRNSLVGGLIGLFVGFILASMVMSVMFFRQVPGQGAGLGFLVESVLFFGFILVGAAVGAGIGSRVPVRNLPPGPVEEPGQRKVRQRATGCGALVGLFGGFFGGFVVFVASKIRFGWKLDDFGVEGALFFGSTFAGALLGAVTCGAMVNRLYRRRQLSNPSPPVRITEERAMANRSRAPRVLAPIFFGAATLAALFSVGWLLEELWFSAAAHGTQGVVRGLTNGEGEDGHQAVVQFQVGQRAVTIQSRVAWDPPAYQVGQTVRVLYPPGQPERGRVSSFWEHVPAILAAILAAVFGLISVATAGEEPAAVPVARPRTPHLARRAGCLLYLGAFSLGGLGLAAAGIARLITFGGAGGVSSFFVLAGLCLLLFCGYQSRGLWSQPARASAAGLAPGSVLAWELPRDRPGRVGLAVGGLFALFWNGGLVVLLVELLRGAVPGWAPFVIALLILGGLLGLGLLALLVFLAASEFPAILGARPARVEISHPSLVPGETGEVLVVQPGPVRLRAWHVLLVCEHRGVFQEGEDAPTETRVRHQEVLVQQKELVIEPGLPAYGARRPLHLPEEAPPSGQSGNGTILWGIRVTGRCGGWRPGFSFEFPLVVTAKEARGKARSPPVEGPETGSRVASE
jgi:hypothetical protein